ncbi:MAG: ATP-binding protein [Candidatus Thorarchaeota archaeon]|jgi:hypothetical protein
MTTNESKYMESSIDNITKNSEKLGAIGSPSTTSQLTIDIFGTAVNKKLLGELGVLRYKQDGIAHYALGQITEVSLKNRMLEQSIGRGIVRQRERWDAVQEKQDTHTAEMSLSAVFSVDGMNIEPSIFGTVPPTGTSLYIAQDPILNALLKPCEDEIFYLGNVYGSKASLPMWFKHFDSGVGGANEAYHIGIFGKTGSGKSVLSKMILLGYLIHKKMGVFILDPQGEFTKGIRNPRMKNGHPIMPDVLCPDILKTINRPVDVYRINDLILDRWDLFHEILHQMKFFRDLGYMSSEKQKYVSESLHPFFAKEKITLAKLANSKTLELVLDEIALLGETVYSDDAAKERVAERANQAKSDPDSTVGKLVHEKWSQISSLFAERQGAHKINSIVTKALSPIDKSTRRLVIIDLSETSPGIPITLWNKLIKPLLIDRFLKSLISQAEYAYKDDKSLNTLVVLDEANRLAPTLLTEGDRWGAIRATLVDAANTTRKYGLGWLFISQTLSSLNKGILNQLRSYFFGFGLGSGAELQALKELVGLEQVRLYQSFKDPHSSFSETHRTYSFMATGPVSPLSFSGAPLFFDAFTESSVFLSKNRILPNKHNSKQCCNDCGAEIDIDPEKPLCKECWKKEMGYG